MGKLKPEHAALVTAYWYPNAKAEPNTWHYFESMIRNYYSVAAYQADDPTKPIGWIMQYPNGHLAHAYVFEEFRRKGLIALLIREICKQILRDGVFPEASTSRDNAIGKLAPKIGAIELCQQKTLKLGCINSYAAH